jgi:hypothetical protein
MLSTEDNEILCRWRPQTSPWVLNFRQHYFRRPATRLPEAPQHQTGRNPSRTRPLINQRLGPAPHQHGVPTLGDYTIGENGVVGSVPQVFTADNIGQCNF